MGMVGPEGMSQAKEINAVRCLTRQAVRLRHKGLRGKCLTFQTPLALLNQSLFDKTADGFGAVDAVEVGPDINALDQVIRQAERAHRIMPDPARWLVYYIA